MHIMALSLVQEENWSSPVLDKTQDGAKGHTELICERHKSLSSLKQSILVHVIDGFVIEESNLPFKGSEEESEVEVKDNVTNNETISTTVNDEKEKIEVSFNSSALEEKDELMSLMPTQCKYCGNNLSDQRVMLGKRFCSASCGKRYSVSCSQRVKKALVQRTAQQATPSLPTPKRGRGRGLLSPMKGGSGRGKGRGVKQRRTSSTLPASGTTTPESPDLPNIPSTTASPIKAEDFHFQFPPRYPLGYGLDEHDLEDELYEGSEPIQKYAHIPVVAWSVQRVAEYISSIPGCSQYCEVFFKEQIDGQALMLLKEEYLFRTMKLKLGPALKIASQLRAIKFNYGIETRTKYMSSPLYD